MEDIFLKRLPFIDLHGYDMDSARVATNDFINENIILKNEKIVIIHGKGMGLVKKSVHEALSKRKEVKELIKYLKTKNANIDFNIFKSTCNVNLNTILGYKKDGKEYSFLDDYDK